MGKAGGGGGGDVVVESSNWKRYGMRNADMNIVTAFKDKVFAIFLMALLPSTEEGATMVRDQIEL